MRFNLHEISDGVNTLTCPLNGSINGKENFDKRSIKVNPCDHCSLASLVLFFIFFLINVFLLTLSRGQMSPDDTTQAAHC